MMCPKNTACAQTIIDQILALLDEEHLKHLIDDPIDAAARQLRCDLPRVFSQAVFHQAISKLVGHIYEYTFRLQLPPPQALDEAIFLLERYYQDGPVHGYTAALIDAADKKSDGLDRILAQLVRIIQARERERYINWVFIYHWGPTDWRSRCEMAALLQDKYRAFLSPELRQCSPAQLADEIPALISNHLSTEKSLRQIKNYSLFAADI